MPTPSRCDLSTPPASRPVLALVRSPPAAATTRPAPPTLGADPAAELRRRSPRSPRPRPPAVRRRATRGRGRPAEQVVHRARRRHRCRASPRATASRSTTLVNYNGWTDGFSHVLQPGDRSRSRRGAKFPDRDDRRHVRRSNRPAATPAAGGSTAAGGATATLPGHLRGQAARPARQGRGHVDMTIEQLDAANASTSELINLYTGREITRAVPRGRAGAVTRRLRRCILPSRTPLDQRR